MERRMTGNCHVRCGAGEKTEMTSKSYLLLLTKKNQKPLLKTRFMLDELGNLQSEGHGIQNLQTMLSIGLGQSQEFTLILQTLQQLRDVYGENCDKIIQGNVSNMIFLKSNDEAMIETLQKLSGITHNSYRDSKTITSNIDKMWNKNEGKVSYTITTKEEPVIKFNDMAFIDPRNSIVFRGGTYPIWNRNETILPMSYRLLGDDLKVPGKEFSFQTLPTTSTVREFDVRKNQPDFIRMLEKRMEQAIYADQAKEIYKDIYEYRDFDITQLDPDVYAEEIMELIYGLIHQDEVAEMYEEEVSPFFSDESFEDNVELKQELDTRIAKKELYDQKLYAGGMLSKGDLVSIDGSVNHKWDQDFLRIFEEIGNYMKADTETFRFDGDTLYSIDGERLIVPYDKARDQALINELSGNPNSRVFNEAEQLEDDSPVLSSYTLTDDFYRFLTRWNKWDFANGRFEDEAKRIFQTA